MLIYEEAKLVENGEHKLGPVAWHSENLLFLKEVTQGFDLDEDNGQFYGWDLFAVSDDYAQEDDDAHQPARPMNVHIDPTLKHIDAQCILKQKYNETKADPVANMPILDLFIVIKTVLLDGLLNQPMDLLILLVFLKVIIIDPQKTVLTFIELFFSDFLLGRYREIFLQDGFVNFVFDVRFGIELI